jgi:hypothetical protein
MTDINPTSAGEGALVLWLDTNAFNIYNEVAGIATPASIGNVTLAGIASSNITIELFGFAQLQNVEPSLWPAAFPPTPAMTFTEFWTYDGLYDASSGDYTGT